MSDMPQALVAMFFDQSSQVDEYVRESFKEYPYKNSLNTIFHENLVKIVASNVHTTF